MKRLLNINTIGTVILVATFATIVICLLSGNGNFIAHVSINN